MQISSHNSTSVKLNTSRGDSIDSSVMSRWSRRSPVVTDDAVILYVNTDSKKIFSGCCHVKTMDLFSRAIVVIASGIGYGGSAREAPSYIHVHMRHNTDVYHSHSTHQ